MSAFNYTSYPRVLGTKVTATGLIAGSRTTDLKIWTPATNDVFSLLALLHYSQHFYTVDFFSTSFVVSSKHQAFIS